jgi:transglutaminase-like putative cysteine protease
MLFNITHTTTYTYETPVSYGLNEVRLTPRSTPGQQVRETEILVEPSPTFRNRRTDYFGNDVTAFGVMKEHARFSITAYSVVNVDPRAVGIGAMSWETTRDRLAEAKDDECLAASEFLYNSPFVALTPDLTAYAKQTLRRGRDLLEAVQDLSYRIHTDFKYEPASTSIETPLTDALRRRRGVCQDFAHIMIGSLRCMGLAARYVSGYVRPGGKFQGAQASHAWVEVFFPGTGWQSFDPTNDIMPSDSHVTIALGRDYSDIVPVKGITLGGGKQTVKVEVLLKSVP